MKNYVYRVWCYTKKNGAACWAVDVEADNQKEACAIGRKLWHKNCHPFGIKATRNLNELEFNYWHTVAHYPW